MSDNWATMALRKVSWIPGLKLEIEREKTHVDKQTETETYKDIGTDRE